MFTLQDMGGFFLSVFILLPIVSVIHQLGHVIFAWLFGGNAKFIVGRGKRLVKIGEIEVNRVYFLDAFCEYKNLKWDNRWTHSIVYLGGVTFNVVPVFILNTFIHKGIVPPSAIFEQFGYFSIYFAFFALIPIYYGKGHPSDGRALYEIWKHGKKLDVID
ncbi:membrane protein [Bacillus coahuilensis m2-6]|uniref:hypothetical protein n=1 Tax=Bacillus coahuilensis TaxID=408580 RepID=UPI000750074B|nr:hypothetical protein [Bacillus coahuilensis]KUP04503.1 membrane protein [Bacillus coahuilensis m2-6]